MCRIITSALTNFSRNPLRRFGFKVGVSVELDLVSVRQLGITTLVNMPGILKDPLPRCLVTELGDSTVLLQFYVWIDQTHTDFLKARSEGIRLVKSAFDQAGIEMPEPIYRIHMAEQWPNSNAAVDTKSVVAAAEEKMPEEKTEKLTAMTSEHDIDVSTDETIPEQVAADLASSDEENLLTK